MRPAELMSLILTACLTGLHPTDVRWLESRALFPRALRLRGKDNKIVLAFYKPEIETWIKQRLRERDAALVEADGALAALPPALLGISASGT